jgi:hypothetical protein
MASTTVVKNIGVTFIVTTTTSETGETKITVVPECKDQNPKLLAILGLTSSRIQKNEYKKDNDQKRSQALRLIKHPRSAFIFYTMDNRFLYSNKMNGIEQARILGKTWKKASLYVRYFYNMKARYDKERYRDDKIAAGLKIPERGPPDLVCLEHYEVDCPWCLSEDEEYEKDGMPPLICLDHEEIECSQCLIMETVPELPKPEKPNLQCSSCHSITEIPRELSFHPFSFPDEYKNTGKRKQSIKRRRVKSNDFLDHNRMRVSIR